MGEGILCQEDFHLENVPLSENFDAYPQVTQEVLNLRSHLKYLFPKILCKKL